MKRSLKHQHTIVAGLLVVIGFFLQSCGGDPSPSNNSTPFAIKAGGTNVDKGSGIAVDASGNSFVVGTFVQKTVIGEETLTSNTSYDNSFIAKYDSKGTVKWAKPMLDAQMINATGVAVDAAGNAYVCGQFINTATIGSTSLTSAGGYDIFLAKYNTNGDLLWAKKTGGTDHDEPFGIALDNNANIYITGAFYALSNIGGTELTGSSYDIFLAKFNSNGESVWAVDVGGSTTVQTDYAYGIDVDPSGNAVITGSINANATIGDDTFNGTGERHFVAKYNAQGEYQWASVGYSGYSEGRAVAIDPSGNIFIAGGMATSFYPVQGNLVFNSYSDYGFIAKYNSAGEFQTARNIPGQSSLFSAVADAAGNVYVASQFDGSTGTVYFSGATGAVAQFNTYGFTDAYVAKFDSNCLAVWAKRGGSDDFDLSTAIAIDEAKNIYTTGYFWGETFTTDLGSVDNTNSSSDIHIWKIKQ